MRPLSKTHPSHFPHLALIQAGLEVEVELLQVLDQGKRAGHSPV
ncbi:MAG: hypothetical protein QME21_13445 [Anaerolineales bacterium]|nr:hypothetical protein [Anaerolineales bacterium]